MSLQYVNHSSLDTMRIWDQNVIIAMVNFIIAIVNFIIGKVNFIIAMLVSAVTVWQPM